MVIRAVVFDVGSVLIYESGVEARDYIAKKYGFSAADFWGYAKKNLELSYRGELSAEDFFNGLISELGLEGVGAEEMIADWLEIREKVSRVDDVVAESVGKLRENYLVGILSNSTFLNERVSVRKNYCDSFAFKILSCDVGFRKPELGIYEILIEKLAERGVKASETIFVDDREENLVPARELGMKTILFEDSEQMIRDLRGLEVEI